MNRLKIGISAVGMGLFLAACGSSGSATTTTPDASSCELTVNTQETVTVNSAGCHVLSRDTHACEAERTAQGLSGYWLKFSCRITLSAVTEIGMRLVRTRADGQPDYKSSYFTATSACYEQYSGATRNPNTLTAQNYVIDFPVTPSAMPQSMARTAIVGLALNGVPVFGNFAAPGDDIFTEAMTFDRCGAHPQGNGQYHYHSGPYAISYDDSNFIGVMRDGYPIYGRKDEDGRYPALDAHGGHTGTTPDSPATPVHHYHLSEQTRTSTETRGQKQWFLTTGTFRGTPAACASCN